MCRLCSRLYTVGEIFDREIPTWATRIPVGAWSEDCACDRKCEFTVVCGVGYAVHGIERYVLSRRETKMRTPDVRVSRGIRPSDEQTLVIPP